MARTKDLSFTHEEQKTIKVLHLPFNVASSASITVNNLNKIAGVEAKGIVLSPKIDSQTSDGLLHLKNRSGTYGLSAMNCLIQLYPYMKWADVLHWYWDSALPFDLDLKLARFLKKPVIIQWHGSDIRNPELVSKNSIFYKDLYDKKLYEYYQLENKESSYKRQLKFSKLNATPIIYPDLEINLQKEIFPEYYLVRHRLDLTSFEPQFSNPQKSKPLVVHISSAHYAKGTNYVLEVIESLKGSLNFDFKLISGVTREEALQSMKNADIVLDQFVIGEHGLAAIEAMSYGKTVFTFLRKDVSEKMPADCPIVNTSPEQLSQHLTTYIKNGEERYRLGIAGRKYVERYHDSKIVTAELKKIYENVIIRHRCK